MQRPQVRTIEPQSEEIKPESNISRTEEEMLLQKYGYGNQTIPQRVNNPKQEMTFEELCRIEDQKIKEANRIREQKMRGPKPITFGGEYNADTTFSQDGDATFKVNIVSDMELPKRNNY